MNRRAASALGATQANSAGAKDWKESGLKALGCWNKGGTGKIAVNERRWAYKFGITTSN